MAPGPTAIAFADLGGGDRGEGGRFAATADHGARRAEATWHAAQFKRYS